MMRDRSNYAIYPYWERRLHVYAFWLVAKYRVATGKFITLPQKELCGTELLANMIVCIQSILWTDSIIVLTWLQNPIKKRKTFLENRTAYIVEKVGKDSWFHVDSKNNPDDLVSRGFTVTWISLSFLWWHWPPWLRRRQWPSRLITSSTEEESKPISVHSTTITCKDILSDFSNLHRVWKIIRYIIHFYYQINRSLWHTSVEHLHGT